MPGNQRPIHPWWVRKSRFLAGLAAFCLCGLAGAAVFLIAEFQFGQEARASADDGARSSHLGYGDSEPDDADVTPYWEPDDHFEQMPEPKPGDWLYSFPEPGQTVEEYFGGGPNAVTSTRHVIYLQPLGEFDESAPDLSVLAEYLELYFGLPTRILPGLDVDGAVTERRAWSTEERQWLTTDLLQIIFERRPDDAYAVLGVTMTDLYPAEDWAFVFGQARFREQVAVHSFARYRPSSEADLTADERERRFLRRVLKVSTHELGHVFGIRHCTHFRCNMNGANNLAEGDASPLYVCPVDLRKLQTNVGFHPTERYAKLAEFWQEHGFVEDARWARRRIAGAQPRAASH